MSRFKCPVIVLIIFTSLFTLMGCTQIKEQTEKIIESIDPQVIEEAEDFLEKQGVDVEEATARAPIIARALVWIQLQVPYNQSGYRDGYRTDCSGFVSYSWELKGSDGKPISPDTVALGNTYGIDISLGDIQSGDIINNKRSGNSGHVVLFVNWLDESQTRFMSYEENGGYGKATQTELTIEYLEDGGFTIKEYNDNAPGPYYAQHSPNLP